MANYKDPGALLAEIRSNPNTLAATLNSDWLPMTLKAGTGGVETFTLKFYDIRGKELAESIACAMQDDTEYSLANALFNSESADCVGLDIELWASAYSSQVPKIARIDVSSLSGTIYIGRGAESNTPYGDFTSGTTYSITGPAAGTTPVLANTSYGIGA